MRRYFIFFLLTVVLMGIISAGCIAIPTPDTPSANLSQILTQSVMVEKNGSTYNIGESYELHLPSNPEEGYFWNITTADNGLRADQKYRSSSSITVLTITAMSEGTHTFTAQYMCPNGAGEPVAVCTIYDSIVVRQTADPPLADPRCVVRIAGTIEPKAGEYILIITPESSASGRVWTADGSDGLEVSESVFTEVNTYAGDGKTYAWLVTAKKPGVYMFEATGISPAGVASSFTLQFHFSENEAVSAASGTINTRGLTMENISVNLQNISFSYDEHGIHLTVDADLINSRTLEMIDGLTTNIKFSSE